MAKTKTEDEVIMNKTKMAIFIVFTRNFIGIVIMPKNRAELYIVPAT